MKITINDVEITNLQRGFVLNDRLDEELDSGIIEFINTNENEYIPFSVVKVFITSDETPDHIYFVDSDSVTLLNKDTPAYYQHTVGLIELTKVLERYAVESIAFTQPREETGLTRYTLGDVVTRLNTIIPLETNARLSTTRKFGYTTEFINELATIKSPQFFFNNQNLFQALVEVFKYIDSIPKISEIVENQLKLDRVDFNKIREIITNSSYNNLAKSINSEYYSNKLEMNVENGITNVVETYPANRTYAPLTSENFIITTNDLTFVLPKPIYQIKSLKMLAKYIDDTSGSNADEAKFKYVDIDLTTITFEEDLYNALKVEDPTEVSKYGSLVYKKGDNRISGFGIAFPQLWGLFATTALNQIYEDYELYDGVDYVITREFGLGDTVLRGLIGFKVEYYPYISQRVSIHKQAPTEQNDYALITNQGGKSIDIPRLITNGQATLNRLGNKDLMIEKVILDYDDRFQVGQTTTDNWIVTNVENAVDEVIRTKAVFTKNFNRLSSFVGVDREIRQYAIPLEEVINRNLKYEEFVVIDSATNTGTTSGWTSNSRTWLKNMFVSGSTNTDTIEGVVVKTVDHNSDTIGRFLLSVSKSYYKNGNIFHFNFLNNQVAYYYPIREVGTVLGTISQKAFKRYVFWDEANVDNVKNGTFDYLTVDLVANRMYYDVADLCKSAATSLAAINDYISIQSSYPRGIFYYLGSDYTDSFGDTSRYALAKQGINMATPALFAVSENDVLMELLNSKRAFSEQLNPASTSQNDYLGVDFSYAYNQAEKFSQFLRTGYSEMTLTDLVVKKDPAEAISMTYQLQFVSKKPHIIVGNTFAQYSPFMVKRSDLTTNQKNLHLYRSTEYYREGELKAKGTKTATAFSNFLVGNVTDGFSVGNTASMTGFNSWAIGDNDGNLYFAVNRKADGNVDSYVYFQFKNKL